MNKAEIASYLVSLHTLMEAQSKVGYSIPSQSLAVEYDKHWKMLKDAIAKEPDDETGNRKDDGQRAEARADLSRNESGVRRPDRPSDI